MTMTSNVLASLMALALTAPDQAPIPAPPQALDLSVIRRIPVQHDGRVMPLDYKRVLAEARKEAVAQYG